MSVKTIKAMLDWVEDNLEADSGLPQMALYVGYSDYYCSAKFHEYVGLSFREYVFRRKISRAAEALLHTDCSIIEIAVQFGFSSHEAFTRAFKKAYGCSPRQYRKSRPDIAVFERIHLEEHSSK